ncbi:MAG: transcriptional regulator [Geobacteraceae bacterium GWC2_55_20]|nr:MAG: transcriptional regulator [Geobacteraceae bacterium GWC2_55_20]OGU24552.1 MAG: transcriptional regulator [Geobacteraceae bacterium GWF2_54_21]HBA73611.1 transcriptional regulator [Geobacter sp.]HCE69182.1 transcriptional regulator [Geobacter sp.]
MKHKSRLLEAVHETAQDLHELGFIDKRALNRYDALCIEPVPSYSAEQIRTLRDRYRISQSVMASIFNTSLSTIQKWEIGEKHPGGPSLKLLNILDRKGIEALI